MGNAYVTVTALKGTGVLNITGTAYDSRLLILIESVSRQIDRYTNRTFYPWSGTVRFSGDSSTLVVLPFDLVSVGTLQEDTNEDGTFETGWAGTGTGGTDYLLEPLDAMPSSTISFQARPYTRIRVNPASNGTQDIFIKAINNYRMTGTFGYSHVRIDGGRNTSASIDSTSTVIDFDASGTAVEIGQTVLIDDEWMFIRNIAGTAMTVDRAVNGSTAATHTATSNINVVQYPGPVQEAVLIQTSRIWKRTESAFTNLVGLDQTGQVAVFQGGLDGDVKALLQPYRKFTI